MTSSLVSDTTLPHEALAARIRNGETPSLEELITFIKHSDRVLTQEKKAKALPEKDVDFF